MPELKRNELPYFIALALYLVLAIGRTCIFSSFLQGPLFKGILLVCLFFLVLKELYENEYSLKTVAVLVAFAAFALVVDRVSVLSSVASIIFIFCGRNIDFRKTAKVALGVTLTCLILAVVCSKAGIIENYIFDPESDRPREFLGFRYALFPSAYLLNAAMIMFYLKKGRPSFIWLAFIFAFNFYLYIKTDSRLSFLLCDAVTLLSVALKIVDSFERPKFIHSPVRKTLAWCSVFSFVIGTALSLPMQIFFNGDVRWMAKADSALGGRLSLGHESVRRFGFSLFGEDIPWVGNGLDINGNPVTDEYLYVDNLYLQFFQKYGVIFAILVLALLTYTIWKAYKGKDYILMTCFVFLAVHALVDDLILYLNYNIFWVLLGTSLFTLGSSLRAGKVDTKIQGV